MFYTTEHSGDILPNINDLPVLSSLLKLTVFQALLTMCFGVARLNRQRQIENGKNEFFISNVSILENNFIKSSFQRRIVTLNF